jgi:hypothetical protein
MERPMNTVDTTASLTALMSELVNGTAPTGGYMLNRGDRGLIAALDKLTAKDASEIVGGGSSIAAHVDHLRYYASLMNRWAGGENPWRGADWKASWRKPSVTPEEWENLKRALSDELNTWILVLGEPRDVTSAEFSGMIASIAHLAYHLGAIRQMDRGLGGPNANNEVDAFSTTTIGS